MFTLEKLINSGLTWGGKPSPEIMDAPVFVLGKRLAGGAQRLFPVAAVRVQLVAESPGHSFRVEGPREAARPAGRRWVRKSGLILVPDHE